MNNLKVTNNSGVEVILNSADGVHCIRVEPGETVAGVHRRFANAILASGLSFSSDDESVESEPVVVAALEEKRAGRGRNQKVADKAPVTDALAAAGVPAAFVGADIV